MLGRIHFKLSWFMRTKTSSKAMLTARPCYSQSCWLCCRRASHYSSASSARCSHHKTSPTSKTTTHRKTSTKRASIIYSRWFQSSRPPFCWTMCLPEKWFLTSSRCSGLWVRTSGGTCVAAVSLLKPSECVRHLQTKIIVGRVVALFLMLQLPHPYCTN